jgi:hypothetical protein
MGEIMRITDGSSQITYDRKPRMHGDSLGRFTFAGILIMAGLIWLADGLNLLPQLGEAQVKDWIFLGAGGLLLLEGVLRVFSPDGYGPSTWRMIVGIVLLGLGASAVFGISLSTSWWPIILIIMGISALGRGFRR